MQLDLALLWLWCRPAAIAPVQPLAWEPPYALGEALKRRGKKKPAGDTVSLSSLSPWPTGPSGATCLISEPCGLMGSLPPSAPPPPVFFFPLNCLLSHQLPTFLLLSLAFLLHSSSRIRAGIRVAGGAGKLGNSTGLGAWGLPYCAFPGR